MSDSLITLLGYASRKPLLTAAQEQALARTIAAGELTDADWFRQPYGTPQSDAALRRRELRAGRTLHLAHEAKNELIERNIRLAHHIARKFQSQTVPLEDLVQYGVIGLHRAAEKFDGTRGFKFSTYATWWVRHMIQRGIHQEQATIRVPGHIIERRRKIDKFFREYPDATNEEAAIKLELTLQQVEDAMTGARVVTSLDAPFTSDDGGGGNRYGIIADESVVDPSDLVPDDYPQLTAAMRRLTPIQKRVLELRFGYEGDVQSRDQIASTLGITPSAVQKHQKAGIIKLKEVLS